MTPSNLFSKDIRLDKGFTSLGIFFFFLNSTIGAATDIKVFISNGET